MHAIETEGLTKDFGFWKRRFRAVDGLNLRVEKGTIHGFLGLNGAGKTTTIKMLIGAIRPTQGSASIMGEPAGSVRARSLIGYSPEHPRFYDMNALDYLELMGRICGGDGARARSRGEELLETFDLEQAKDRSVQGFSAGMSQKLSLVQALIHEPDILILDEPTSNLDPVARYGLLKKLRELVTERDLTVLVSSHILSEIEKVSDEVTIISRGRTVVENSIDGLKQEFAGNHFILDASDNQQAFSLLSQEASADKVWLDKEHKVNIMAADIERLRFVLPKLLADNGLSLNAFAAKEFSLESIFMTVIGEGWEEQHQDEMGGAWQEQLDGSVTDYYSRIGGYQR